MVFAALADRENEGVFVEGCVAVAEFAGVFHLHRDAGILFDEIFGDEARVPGGAAAEEEDAVDLPELARLDIEAAELGRAAVLGKAPAHGIFQRHGLLIDLLEHVVRVDAQFRVFDAPIDRADNGIDCDRVDRGDVEILWGEVDNLPVAQINDILGAPRRRR